MSSLLYKGISYYFKVYKKDWLCSLEHVAKVQLFYGAHKRHFYVLQHIFSHFEHYLA